MAVDHNKALESRICRDIPWGERSLVIFRRQYLQRLPLSQIQWPPSELLRDYEVQQWLFEMLIKKPQDVNYAAPEKEATENLQKSTIHASTWQKNLWAELLKRIERSVQGTADPDIFDPLMEECAQLQQIPVLADAEEAQQDVLITYELGEIDMLREASRVSLLERPRVLSGSSCTGHRTWEAALALGTEIVTTWLPAWKLKDKAVLELGAGTGLLSFLCASSELNSARRVVATDGDEEAVQRLLRNHKIHSQNYPSLASRLKFGVYRWGEPLEQTIIGEEIALHNFDIVLAADVTYDPHSIPSLVLTLVELFDRNRDITCVLSATVRNEETFNRFLQECQLRRLRTTISAPPQEEQTCLFHSSRDSIRFINLMTA